jgi:hypothetical protein
MCFVGNVAGGLCGNLGGEGVTYILTMTIMVVMMMRGSWFA